MGRLGHGMVAVDGHIVIYGGLGGEDMLTEFSDTWVFNPATKTWATGNVIVEEALYDFAYTYVQSIGSMVVFGGQGDNGYHDDTSKLFLGYDN